MAYRKILEWPNEKLFKKAKRGEDFGEETQNLIKDLIDTCNVSNGAGLAANQIGVLKQVVVIKPRLFQVEEEAFEANDYKSDFLVLINPEVESSGDPAKWRESCLSIPDVSGLVQRSSYVLVNYQNEKGEKKMFEVGWPMAGAIQHECDHLDGYTFNKRMNRMSASLLIKKYQKIRKKKQRELRKSFKR